MPLSTASQTFDRIEKAHAAWTRGGATIAVVDSTPRGTSRARFRLDLDGTGGVTLRATSPAQGKSDATDQTYRLIGGTLIGVDHLAHETLRHDAPPSGPLGLRLIAALNGGMDDSVSFLLIKATREHYLSPMRQLTGWQTTKTGLQRSTTAAGKVSLTRLEVDAAGRLKGLHVAFPGSRLDWVIAYDMPHAFLMPRGYTRVDNFTARPRPPVYADAKAKAVVERALRASGKLQYAIARLDAAATLWVGGSHVRYENGEAGFAYDGSRLTVVTPGAAYEGRSSRRAVIDYVAATLGTVDPMVRSILVRTPINAELFLPEARVRVVGTMASAGQLCDVVSVNAPRYRASLFLRKSDGLPASVETEALGANGASLSRTTRTLVWSSLGTTLPKNLFALRLRAGQKVLPLPPLAKPRL